MTLVAWSALLGGALLAGAAVLTALVIRSGREWLPLTAMVSATAVSVWGLRQVIEISGRIGTSIPASFLAICSVMAGYALASGMLPMLARPGRSVELPPPGHSPLTRVVLVACSEPERYDPFMVAAELKLYEDSGVEIAGDSAKPLVFAAEKARYKAVGGSPSAPMHRAVADRLASELSSGGAFGAVTTADCSAGSLERAVAEAVAEGPDVVVAPLSVAEEYLIDRAEKAVAAMRPTAAGARVHFARALWSSEPLAEWLVSMVFDAAEGQACDHVGVVLAGHGRPAEWLADPTAPEQENYLYQRVRKLLLDRGFEETLIRQAWMQWQEPTVSEAVRHVAALGARWIVVAPILVPLPSLATSLELRQEIGLARVPTQVHVATLPPWGDSEEVVRVLADSVRAAVTSADA